MAMPFVLRTVVEAHSVMSLPESQRPRQNDVLENGTYQLRPGRQASTHKCRNVHARARSADHVSSEQVAAAHLQLQQAGIGSSVAAHILCRHRRRRARGGQDLHSRGSNPNCAAESRTRLHASSRWLMLIRPSFCESNVNRPRVLHYGECVDPAKMTNSTMALIKRD